ncbi:hypothetical protein [Glutamicibacter sp.]|uniref:hypothetical protein n=1 Tax=Glutamicibacter sp. TaxID=1931995 RepID=UPI002B46849B|nr:hypothetical protein [Glutamicibacter sp.]HJX77308.1 hypothetical protein [Glutamicibacter sp.]
MTIQEILTAHRPLANAPDDTVCACDSTWRPNAEYRAHLSEVLEKHMREREAQLRQLVRDMTDPGACWFDHHGGCQEHGYLDLKPGEQCPHTEAKQLLGDEPNGR